VLLESTASEGVGLILGVGGDLLSKSKDIAFIINGSPAAKEFSGRNIFTNRTIKISSFNV
jgi:hypothetical protein